MSSELASSKGTDPGRYAMSRESSLRDSGFRIVGRITGRIARGQQLPLPKSPRMPLNEAAEKTLLTPGYQYAQGELLARRRGKRRKDGAPPENRHLSDCPSVFRAIQPQIGALR